jgi:hypothetical protein
LWFVMAVALLSTPSLVITLPILGTSRSPCITVGGGWGFGHGRCDVLCKTDSGRVRRRGWGRGRGWMRGGGGALTDCSITASPCCLVFFFGVSCMVVLRGSRVTVASHTSGFPYACRFPLPTFYPSSLQLPFSPLSPSPVTTFPSSSLSCSPLPRPPSPSPAVWLRRCWGPG